MKKILIQKTKKIISKSLGCDISDIQPNNNLCDISQNLDSLFVFAIAAELQKIFCFSINDFIGIFREEKELTKFKNFFDFLEKCPLQKNNKARFT